MKIAKLLGVFLLTLGLLFVSSSQSKAESLTAPERIIAEKLNPTLANSPNWTRVGSGASVLLVLEQNNITYIFSIEGFSIGWITDNRNNNSIYTWEFVGGDWKLVDVHITVIPHEYCPL